MPPISLEVLERAAFALHTENYSTACKPRGIDIDKLSQKDREFWWWMENIAVEENWPDQRDVCLLETGESRPGSGGGHRRGRRRVPARFLATRHALTCSGVLRSTPLREPKP